MSVRIVTGSANGAIAPQRVTLLVGYGGYSYSIMADSPVTMTGAVICVNHSTKLRQPASKLGDPEGQLRFTRLYNEHRVAVAAPQDTRAINHVTE